MTNKVVTPEEVIHLAVAAIRRGEACLPGALDDLPTPIYATDAEGRLKFFNRACVGFAGRVPQPEQDRWCVSWKLFTAEGSPLPHDRCPMAVAIHEKREVRGARAVAERPDGTRTEFVPYPTPVLDDEGQLIGAVNLLQGTDGRAQTKHLKAQASRCRRLAKSTTDQRMAETLKLMAAEYEEQARSIDYAH